MAADTLKDYELRDKALRIMAERMERMDCRYLKDLSPRLMRSLVTCDRMGCGGEVLSEKIAQWIRVRDNTVASGDNANNNINTLATTTTVVSPLSDEDFYWITHIQQMPQISHHEALFYLHYGSKYPNVMNEVGPGSLKHRCLTAISESSWATDKLVAHLEHPESVEMELYQELETGLKIQLLECALVGVKKISGENQATRSSSQEMSESDVELSNQLMYNSLLKNDEKNNNMAKKCNKVVVFGCGIASANGVYLTSSNDTNIPQMIASPRAMEATYEKEAVWNGSRVTFLIIPVKSGKYYTHYKLCVRQKNDTAIRVLYTSPTSTGSESIKASIPEYGWEVEGGGDAESSVFADECGGIYPAPVFVGIVGGGGSAKV